MLSPGPLKVNKIILWYILPSVVNTFFYHIDIFRKRLLVKVEKLSAVFCRHHEQHRLFKNPVTIAHFQMVMWPCSLLIEGCLFRFVTLSRKPLKYVLLSHGLSWQLIKYTWNSWLSWIGCPDAEHLYTELTQASESLFPLPEKWDQCWNMYCIGMHFTTKLNHGAFASHISLHFTAWCILVWLTA